MNMWTIIVCIFSTLMFWNGYAFDDKLRKDGAGKRIITDELALSRNPRDVEGGIGFIPENRDSKKMVGTEEMDNKNKSMDPNEITNLKLMKLGNSYYYFATEKVNYFKATEFCRKHKMDLLSIESKRENDLISNVLRNLTGVEHVWTSGTDLHEEGKFCWLATGDRLTFTNWEPNQPDNLLTAEHCLEILKVRGGNYFWNDSWCTYNFNFVCEAKRCSEFCVE